MCVCSDMGKMRSDGGFIIEGRVADVMRFKVFAKVIYPTPIEEALGTHPSILDIQVRHKKNLVYCFFKCIICLVLVVPSSTSASWIYYFSIWCMKYDINSIPHCWYLCITIISLCISSCINLHILFSLCIICRWYQGREMTGWEMKSLFVYGEFILIFLG